MPKEIEAVIKSAEFDQTPKEEPIPIFLCVGDPFVYVFHWLIKELPWSADRAELR